MKPGIPETGTVIRLEGGSAVIRMRSDGGSCGKCGLAKAGMCTGALTQLVTVTNSAQARVGDIVKIGLVRNVQYRGYLSAYVIPTAGLLFGIAGGGALGAALGFPPLDIIGGLFLLLLASFFSFRALRRLDSSSSIEIVSVLSDPWAGRY